MQFTLTYDGPLHSTANSSRKAEHKQRIRDQLRPQLEELWTHDPLSWHRQFLSPDPSDAELSVLVERDGNWYAPLVARSLFLTAELDITLLRPELPGGIITSGGDLDNRLKTLLDALSVPTAQQAVLDPESATAGNPFFTLLEDDALVRRIGIDTDRWLHASAPDEVRVAVGVTLQTNRLTFANMNLVN